MVIRAPVSWHPHWCSNKQRMQMSSVCLMDFCCTEQQPCRVPSIHSFILIDLRNICKSVSGQKKPKAFTEFVFLSTNVLLDIKVSVLPFKKYQVYPDLKMSLSNDLTFALPFDSCSLCLSTDIHLLLVRGFFYFVYYRKSM